MKLISDQWNTAVRKEATPPKPRTHIWASEIGMPYLDRYLRMTGITPTNEAPDKVLRAFDAGKVIEFLVTRTLAAAGILNRKQVELRLPETEKHLGITGCLDATIGGFSDWGVAQRRTIEHTSSLGLDIDDLIREKSQGLVSILKEQYPSGWPEEIVVEIKSINSYIFNNFKAQVGGFKGYEHNRLQLYAYLVMTKLRQGILLYVSKDDFTLGEIGLTIDDQALRSSFVKDVLDMTHYIRNEIQPPSEPILIYDEKKGKYDINKFVVRSPYLKYIYGYDTVQDVNNDYHQTVLDINKALRHMQIDKVKPEDVQIIEEYQLHKHKDTTTIY